jgi:hypothetical protein
VLKIFTRLQCRGAKIVLNPYTLDKKKSISSVIAYKHAINRTFYIYKSYKKNNRLFFYDFKKRLHKVIA